MDNSEILIQYFIQLEHQPRNGKITAQAVRDAAAATTGDISGIIDAILAHAKAKGINPEKELSELYAAQSKAKAAAAEKQRRADMKARAAEIEHLAATLKEKSDDAAPDELSEAMATISKEAAGLITTSATVNRFPSWADFESACNIDTTQNFSPSLFGQLTFPEGTVSYIGARTGRGKTTALVNIGIEALFPPYTGINPRRVLFVSLEESHVQILRRFSFCLAYRKATSEERTLLGTIKNPKTKKTSPIPAYHAWKRGRDLGVKEYGNGTPVFVQAIKDADAAIKTEVETGNLVFFNGIGASLSETIAAVRGRGRGDIVLLDYIQKIPGAGQSYSGNPDLERIRKGSEGLIEAALGAECVVIAGAQFNRDSVKTQQEDEFTDADFRGCGDIEQDGHNLLGIGRALEFHYYGIIKSREGEISDKRYNLDFAGGYSFMAKGTGEYIPPPKPSRARGSKNNKDKIYNSNGTVELVEFTGGEILGGKT